MFPFVYVFERNLRHKFLTAAFSFSVFAVGEIASTKKHMICFFNKKGKYLQATKESVGYLLKDEKDLIEAYEHEKKFNSIVYTKYLILMNQKYPLY